MLTTSVEYRRTLRPFRHPPCSRSFVGYEQSFSDHDSANRFRHPDPMAYVVTAYCDKCKHTQCVDVCPAEAFREGETMLYIDPETCIECELCAAECPVEAIYPDSEVPKKWRVYIDLNKEMAADLPLILARKEPLPTAKTLEELQAMEGSRRPATGTGRARHGRSGRRHHRRRSRNWS